MKNITINAMHKLKNSFKCYTVSIFYLSDAVNSKIWLDMIPFKVKSFDAPVNQENPVVFSS